MSTKHLPELRELHSEERKYTYSQSNQIESQTGLIGHMRADFGSGSAFFIRWEPHVWDEKLNKEDFRTDFDRLINCLRNNMFKKRSDLSKYCYSHPEASFGDGRTYGIRIDTDAYTYMFRFDPNPGVYNIYCYCYKQDWLNQHIVQAANGIRFVDPEYNELFRVADGDDVIVTEADGSTNKMTVRYVDDYHMEIGWSFDSTIYHIVEYAELCADAGRTVRPASEE